MSDTTNTSDHWGQYFIDCLIRKAKSSFSSGNVIDEKHVLIDQNESNAVEDASKNLDSIEKDQRSQNNPVMSSNNPVMSSRRTKQTSQKMITKLLMN